MNIQIYIFMKAAFFLELPVEGIQRGSFIITKQINKTRQVFWWN